MEFNEDIIKKTVQFGVLEYPLSKAVNILDLSQKEEENYIVAFNTEGSPIAKAYQKGKDMADFAFDTKLFEMGRAGDMKAMEKFESRKRLMKFK